MLEIKLRKSIRTDEDFVNDLTRKVMMSYVEKTWEKKEDQEKYFYTNQFDLENTQIIQYNGKDIGRITLIRHHDYLYIDNIHLSND